MLHCDYHGFRSFLERRGDAGDEHGALARLHTLFDLVARHFSDDPPEPEHSIQLRPQDLALLHAQASDPGLMTRSGDGHGNNLTPGREYWGSAEQPFVRLAPGHFEPLSATPTTVRAISADGVTPLPNPRLISDVIAQQPLGADGNAVDQPNSFGTNLFLMSFGQFFDHGLDFIARGGGSFLVPIGDMDEQLAAAQARLDAIRADEGLPPITLDPSDNLLAQLEADPRPFEFLIGSRGARFDVAADGSVVVDANGTPLVNNATGTVHVNKTASFVEQSQTYGSSAQMLYLLRESARTESGELIADGDGGWAKTHRMLEGEPEIGPDGVARGNLPTYADILINNGVSRAELDRLIDDIAEGRMTNFEAWTELTALAGYVYFADIGDGKYTILIGDKNDAFASPFDRDGISANPGFSFANLLDHYVAGDHRVNENVALTAVHTIWMREHNFQAERLEALRPDWTDEEVFQAARILQTAQYQRIVFAEFAAALAGGIPGPSHGFSGYNPDVNPGISMEFAGAMYRVGHSMINETIPFTDAAGNTQEIPLFSAFLNPAMYAGRDPLTGGVGGAAAIILGETGAAHQMIDHQIVEVIRSKLLGVPLDLYAANIVRARELGLVTLNEFRRYVSENGSLIEQAGQESTAGPGQALNLNPYETWAEFGASLRGTPEQQAELLALFKAVYGEDDIHVNDVELFVGGLAEAPVGQSQMGSTFTWIFIEQLDRLQEGDRFYYFNQLQESPLLLADIGSQHFSDLIMRNTGIEHMHHSAFSVSETVALGPNERNRDFSDLAVDPDHVLVLVGNDRGNRITGTAGDDTLYGEGGDDRLDGGLGLDALYGGDGDDRLSAGPSLAGVFAYGEAGADNLIGGAGADNLIGGSGDDRIAGGAGLDFLSGGAGDDWLTPGADPNMIDGGDGRDTVDFSDSPAGVTIDLGMLLDPVPGLGGYAQGDVIGGVEDAIGSIFADSLTGDDGRNRLSGGRGDDRLSGLGGDDMLTGGKGDDLFVFGPGFGDDRILDFDAQPGGGQDRIDLSAFGITADSFADRVDIDVFRGNTRIRIDGDAAQTILLAGVGGHDLVTAQDFVLG